MGGQGETTSDLASKLGAFGGELTLADLFPASWMRAHTECADIEAFLTTGEFDFRSPEEFRNRDVEAWDDYVRQRSEFDSWGEMLTAAVDAYAG